MRDQGTQRAGSCSARRPSFGTPQDDGGLAGARAWVDGAADDQRGGLQEWIKLWNEAARRFTWTRTADQIIDRICRYCSRISGPAH